MSGSMSKNKKTKRKQIIEKFNFVNILKYEKIKIIFVCKSILNVGIVLKVESAKTTGVLRF